MGSLKHLRKLSASADLQGRFGGAGVEVGSNGPRLEMAMRKIRLEVEELEVESFAAETALADRGTVRAAMSGDIPCETQYGNYTCDGWYSCDRWVECDATFVEPTCPHVGDC